MLDSVNMTPHRRTQIRRLSGGQIKRASWINEAICNPSLIFLDEVTSGLDEQTDCEMMQLFRRMADDGKTIVCVTHSLANVEQNCDLLVLLAPGGALAYIGPPGEAKAYFRVERLGNAYQRLTEGSPREWKWRFQESSLYDEYVRRRLPDASARAPRKPGKSTSTARTTLKRVTTGWRQFSLLTRRYLAILWSDKKPLAMMLGQSLFIAALLTWLFGDISNLDVETEAQRMAEDVTYDMEWEDLFDEDQDEFREKAEEIKRAAYSAKLLFLLCISCLWFGCNNSAKEIVKERSIYEKERDTGLNFLSSYGSKLLLLSMLSVLQASLLYFCALYFTRLGGNVLEQWVLLSLTAVAGTAMGLAISAVSNTSDLAATIVPISLIPQIIFSGLMAPLDGLVRTFSQVFVTAYWSYQGLLSRLGPPLNSRLRDSDLCDLGDDVSLTAICGFLVAHTAIFAAVAIVALYGRGVKEKPLGRLLRRSRMAATERPRATSR
jgi:energy-coupling factor transporter ATP-binding protein EcfA2